MLLILIIWGSRECRSHLHELKFICEYSQICFMHLGLFYLCIGLWILCLFVIINIIIHKYLRCTQMMSQSPNNIKWYNSKLEIRTKLIFVFNSIPEWTLYFPNICASGLNLSGLLILKIRSATDLYRIYAKGTINVVRVQKDQKCMCITVFALI